MLIKKTFLIVFFIIFASNSFSQNVETYQYAEKNGEKLYLDIYKTKTKTDKPLLVFVFGGGFIRGTRNDSSYLIFFKTMTDKGYNIASIDYRLGLKGTGQPGVLNTKPLQNAVKIAVQDLFSAVRYLTENEKVTGVDAKKIVTIGSSAGAITVLQADYTLCNRLEDSKLLPENFKFAGVIPFSGAVFSNKGKPKYKNANPAPTLFFHGTADKVVTYKKIHFFRLYLAGTKKLVKIFDKKDFPYYVYRYKDLKHEVAEKMFYNANDVDNFINDYVVNGKKLKKDLTVYNPDDKPAKAVGSTKELYKNN